ncbi:MAG: LysR family transcriptional regulator [Paracoccaceae bacterium]
MSRLRRLVPSLNTLFSFEAAVRCGSFARAAAELGVTAPAVSRNIGRLEDHIGQPLFHRTATGAQLSPAGERLHLALRNGFAEIERALADLHQRAARPDPVVLSVSSAYATHWFIPRLSRFREDFPGVEVRFELIGGLIGGGLGDADIAMRFDPDPSDRLHIQPLFPEQVIPVAAPGYRGQVQPGRLLEGASSFIELRGAEPDWTSLLGSHGAGGADAGMVISDYSVVVQAALLSQGLALGWVNVVSRLLCEGQLQPVGDRLVKSGRICCLLRRKVPRNTVVPAICDWIAARHADDLASLARLYPALFGATVQDRAAA